MENDALPMPEQPERHRRYWRRVRILTLAGLVCWFGVTFMVIFFARELAAYRFFDWPVSFYMAAQGLTLFYVLIIGLHALVMHLFDKQRRSDAGHGE